MDSARCHCDAGMQIVNHVLTTCPSYSDQRNKILWGKPPQETDYYHILSCATLAKRAALDLQGRPLILDQWHAPWTARPRSACLINPETSKKSLFLEEVGDK